MKTSTYLLTTILFSLTLSGSAQTRSINEGDLIIDYYGIHSNDKGKNFEGKYEITSEDGTIGKYNFTHGLKNGLMNFHDPTGKLIWGEQYLYGSKIDDWYYDELGDKIANSQVIEMKVIVGKMNKKGIILNGEVEFVSKSIFSSGRQSIQIKGGYIHGDWLYFGDEVNPPERHFYQYGKLLKVTHLSKDGNPILEIKYCSIDLANDKRKRVDFSDYISSNGKDELGNVIWKDKNQRPLNGDYIIVSNNYVFYEASFVNGIEDGVFKNYNLWGSGMLEDEANYKHGVAIGLSVVYTESSIEKSYYRNGIKHGLYSRFSIYDGKGLLTDSVNYENGVKSGIEQKRWFSGEYVHRSGELEKNNYVKGKLHGEKKIYFANDTLKETGNYLYGVKNGIFISYDTLGDVISEDRYKYDKLHGSCKWYQNGKLSSESEYKIGTKVKEITYYNNGKIESKEWLEGDKWKSETYYPSGVIKSIGIQDYRFIKYGLSLSATLLEGDMQHTKTYNEKGIIQFDHKKIVFEPNGSDSDIFLHFKTIELEYDDKGQLIKETNKDQ